MSTCVRRCGRTDTDPRPLLWPALHLADVVKMSAEEFAWLAVDGEQAAIDRLWLGRTRLIVVTDGSRPLRWFHPDAEGELPCYPVEAVDTTAAGDAFVGGLLCCLAELDAAPSGSISWSPSCHACTPCCASPPPVAH
jgi:Sugar kinases, ribokinase family